MLVLDPLVALLVAANIVWTVTAHLEPLEDPASWDDRGLDRRA